MSLFLALNTALSGLNVNQAALSVVSNNIANANTPGYSRQVLDQSALLVDGVGAGARIDAISRKIDVYLERSIQRETSNVSMAEKTADYYERIQIMLGEPGLDNSIDEYTQSFFNSLQDLAESPDKVSFQASVINTAEVLARELSGIATSLEDLRLQADADINEGVAAVNAELAHLDALNVAIERASVLNLPTAGLFDQRDNAIEKVASYLNVSIYYKPSGAVNLFTSSGVPLVDDAPHRLAYTPASGLNEFVNDKALNPLQVVSFDERGNETRRDDIISAGVEHAIDTSLTGGSIEGLRELRDEILPDILAQMDELAAGIRDAVNAVHNAGSGYPPAEELSGTRLVTADEAFDWSGTARIVVMNADGSPVDSPYSSESHTGLRPLTLNFDTLDAGLGEGVLTAQAIINEINNHFNAPPVKAGLNNLNNIQLVSNNNALPAGSSPSFNFDLDLENISNFGSEVWVTDVSIADDTAAVIGTSATGEVTNTAPAYTISSFDFTNASRAVTVNTTTPPDVAVGDRIYLNNPGGVSYAAGTVAAAQLEGFFTVTAVNGNSFEININAAAGATSAGEAPVTVGAQALSEYIEVDAGEKTRSKANGTFTADLSGNAASTYYDVTVTVRTFNPDPDSTQAYQSGTITYRVYNNEQGLRNDRYDAFGASGATVLSSPASPHQYIFATLVDANGVELSETNGSYGNQSGYLQLTAHDLSGQEFAVVIDEGTSKQEGKVTDQVPPIKGTNRGFSHYFELNNLFASNNPDATGDAKSGSAINLAVERRLLDNPSLISTGSLELSNQPNDPDAPRLYTYERYIGNNSIAQRLAAVGTDQQSFAGAGGLPDSSQNINGYIGEVLAFVATQTVTAKSSFTDATLLFDGLVSRADAITGVNLDEELANTTLYQSAYSASAQVISTTNDLFDALFSIFN